MAEAKAETVLLQVKPIYKALENQNPRLLEIVKLCHEKGAKAIEKKFNKDVICESFASLLSLFQNPSEDENKNLINKSKGKIEKEESLEQRIKT